MTRVGDVLGLARAAEVECDGIDGDAALGQLQRGRTGQCVDGRPAGRVVHAGRGDRNACEVHDRTACTQVTSRLPADENAALAPILLRALNSASSTSASPREDDGPPMTAGTTASTAPARLHGLGEEALHVQLVGHVGAHRFGHCPAGQDRLDGRLGLSLVVGVVDDHRPPFARQSAGSSSADPAGGPCDDHQARGWASC